MVWDPAQYLKFADQRLRSAIDLLNRIAAADPAEVCDLGAGAGNVTRLLKARWRNARVTGVDASKEMLAKAATVWRAGATRQFTSLWESSDDMMEVSRLTTSE